jgi:2-oxoglutarate dehydrogenase E2 component (dihydrolipoamide succinyltransferase)
MAVEIKVPALGESVTEATVAKWFKKVGDAVAADEPLVELETDKVTVEVPAPAAGSIAEIRAEAGATVNVGALLGMIAAGAAPAKAAAKAAAPAAVAPAAKAAPAPAAPAKEPGPAARKMMAETGVVPASGSGKDGRVTKADVLAAIASPAPASAPAAAPQAAPRQLGAGEERVKMTRLRKRIAERLKQAQNTAAMLTTFNEADMGAVMALRTKYNEAFEKRHGVKLGFMSFFVKACVAALKEIPAVNAEIDGDDIIYKNHYDIGVAVGTEQGLVVPVLRGCDAMNLADIEKAIGAYGRKARDGKIALDDLTAR